MDPKFQAMLEAAMKSGEAFDQADQNSSASSTSSKSLEDRLKSKNFGIRRKAYTEALKDPKSVPPSKELIVHCLKTEKNVLLIKQLLSLLSKEGFKEISTGDITILRKCFKNLNNRKFFEGIKELTLESLKQQGAPVVYEAMIGCIVKEKLEKVKDAYLQIFKAAFLHYGILAWPNDLFLQFLHLLETLAEEKFTRKSVGEIVGEINKRVPIDVKVMLKLKYPKCGLDEIQPSVEADTCSDSSMDKLLSIDTLTKKRKKKKFFKVLAKMNFFKLIESPRKVKKQKKLLDALEEKMALYNTNDYDEISAEKYMKLAKTLVAFIKKSSPLLNVAVTCLKFCRPLNLNAFPDAAVVLLNKCKEKKNYLLENIHSCFFSNDKDRSEGKLSYVVLNERLHKRLADNLDLKSQDVIEGYLLFLLYVRAVKKEVCGHIVTWIIEKTLTHAKPDIRKNSMGVVEKLMGIDPQGTLLRCEKYAAEQKIDSSKMKKIRGFASKAGVDMSETGAGGQKQQQLRVKKKKKKRSTEDILTLVSKKKYSQITLMHCESGVNAGNIEGVLRGLSSNYRMENLLKNRVVIMKVLGMVVGKNSNLLTSQLCFYFIDICFTAIRVKKARKKSEKKLKGFAKSILDTVGINLLLKFMEDNCEGKKLDYFLTRLDAELTSVKKTDIARIVKIVAFQYFRGVKPDVCVGLLRRMGESHSAAEIWGYIEILQCGGKKEKAALKKKMGVVSPKQNIIEKIRKETPQNKMIKKDGKKKKIKRRQQPVAVNVVVKKKKKVMMMKKNEEMFVKRKKEEEVVVEKKKESASTSTIDLEVELKKVFALVKERSGSTNEHAIHQSFELLRVYMRQVSKRQFVFNFSLFSDLNNSIFFALESPLTAKMSNKDNPLLEVIVDILLEVFSNYQLSNLLRKEVLTKHMDFLFEKFVLIDEINLSRLAKKMENVLSKMLVRCNKTVSFQCLVCLLDPERRRKSEQDMTKYLNYVTRSLLTLLKMCNANEIDLDMLLFEIDNFFRKYPPRTNPGMQQANRLLKTMLLKFLREKGEAIKDNFRLLRDDNSLVVRFVLDELKLIKMKQSLGAVFEKIKNEETLEEGIKELHRIRKEHPLFDLSQELQKFSAPFRKYIESELNKMDQ